MKTEIIRRVIGNSGLVTLAQFSLTFTSTYWVDTTNVSRLASRLIEDRKLYRVYG